MRKTLSPTARAAANEARLNNRAAVITTLAIGPQITPVHEKAVEVLSELMTLGTQLSGAKTPAYLRATMRTLTKSKPFILEGISDVPAHLIQQWMGELIARIQPILDIELPEQTGGAHAGTDDGAAAAARADLTPSA